MLHNLLLIGHLLGVVALVAGLGIEASAMVGLVQGRSPESVRGALYRVSWLKGLMPVAVVLLFGGGIGLSVTGPHGAWSNLWTVPWITVSLIITLVMTVVGLGVIEPNLARAEQLAHGGQLTPALLELARNRRLHLVAWSGIGSVVGIIILMAAKPTLVGCLVIVGATVLAGLLIARRLLASNAGRPLAATPSA